MKKINWGIIGCGDVTEIKSGPAFNKVPNSNLIAVMRRDAGKAKDYALRHHVLKWYSDAYELIADPDINAIYIATPPSSHEEYSIAALHAGKPVYLEKPMTLNVSSAKKIAYTAKTKNIKLSVAHYRRAQPMFIKVKQLLDSNEIGEARFVELKFLQPSLSIKELEIPKVKWRIDPAISGGGLFHDLAPHQLDLMFYFFGGYTLATGIPRNQLGLYAADDIVSGQILFANGVIFQGLWCFTVPDEEAKDLCTIIGSSGKISFSIFGDPEIIVTKNGLSEIIRFEKLPHVQQPMIEKVVEYFLDQRPNPCSAEDGVYVMGMMEDLTAVCRQL